MGVCVEDIKLFLDDNNESIDIVEIDRIENNIGCRVSFYYNNGTESTFTLEYMHGSSIFSYIARNFNLKRFIIGEINFSLSKTESLEFCKCSFTKTKFDDAVFRHCTFDGCLFHNCHMESLDFNHCTFTNCNIITSEIEVLRFLSCIIDNIELKSNFIDSIAYDRCNFSMLNMKNNKIKTLQYSVIYDAPTDLASIKNRLKLNDDILLFNEIDVTLPYFIYRTYVL